MHAGRRLLAQAMDGLQQVRVATMHDRRQVTAIVQDHVERLAVLEAKRLLDAPLVLFLRLALPGIDRDPGLGDRRSSVVLRREDVARGPRHLRAEFDQRLDQHRGLDRHVQATGNACALQRLLDAEALAQRHEARHLLLGQTDLLASPVRQGQIRDLECLLLARFDHDDSLRTPHWAPAPKYHSIAIER